MEEPNSLPKLSAEEVRLLGALIEKSKATPEYYPMTINALQAACNQKTSRKPVVSYDEHTIIATLDSLGKKGLGTTVAGGGRGGPQSKLIIAVQHPVVPAELAALCLLFLRGPLTAGAINSNSGRLHEYESLDEVQELLNKLAPSTPAYVRLLPRMAGQKESRYIHLFAEFDDEAYEATVAAGSTQQTGQIQALEQRVTDLEEQLNTLRAEFDKLL